MDSQQDKTQSARQGRGPLSDGVAQGGHGPRMAEVEDPENVRIVEFRIDHVSPVHLCWVVLSALFTVLFLADCLFVCALSC